MHNGTYWGIRTGIANYGLSDALPCPLQNTAELAATPTRLKRLEPEYQERLINWGYAVCDAALRTHLVEVSKTYCINVLQKPQFPYARGV